MSKKAFIFIGVVFSGMLLAACSPLSKKTTQNNPMTASPQPIASSLPSTKQDGNKPLDGAAGRQLPLADSAKKLGVTEAALLSALSSTVNNGKPDLAAAAQKLGVTTEALKTALGAPATMPSGEPSDVPAKDAMVLPFNSNTEDDEQ